MQDSRDHDSTVRVREKQQAAQNCSLSLLATDLRFVLGCLAAPGRQLYEGIGRIAPTSRHP